MFGENLTTRGRRRQRRRDRRALADRHRRARGLPAAAAVLEARAALRRPEDGQGASRQASRPGAYLRIVTEGELAAGDEVDGHPPPRARRDHRARLGRGPEGPLARRPGAAPRPSSSTSSRAAFEVPRGVAPWTCSNGKRRSPPCARRSPRRAGRSCWSPARPGSARPASCARSRRTPRAQVLLTACDDLRAPRTLGPLRDVLGAGRRPVHRAAGGAHARAPTCWSSRTSTGPTTPRSTCSPTPRAGSSTLPRRPRADLPRRGAARAAARCSGVVASVAASPARARAAQPRCGGAAQRPAAAPTPTRCTGSPAATRSSSPRCSPRRRGSVPASVTDAVLARVGRLSADCRAALDQLSVVPSAAGAELARSCA